MNWRTALRLLAWGVVTFGVVVGYSHIFASFWDALMHDSFIFRAIFCTVMITVGIALGDALFLLLEDARERGRDGHTNRRYW